MGDRTMFLVIGACLAAYALVLVTQGIYKIYKWIQREDAGPETVEIFEEWKSGAIPRDYSKKMKAAMQEVNARQEASAYANDLAASDDAIYRFEKLKSIRTEVARIRARGYRRGEADRYANQFKPEAAPYPKGSGAAQQWVRGYCQGQNIMDIKQYYDEA